MEPAGDYGNWALCPRTTIMSRLTRAVLPVAISAFVVLGVALSLACSACTGRDAERSLQEGTGGEPKGRVVRTEEEWRNILPPDRYEILRAKGTERAFSGEYEDHWDDGVYHCYACDLPLFASKTKFRSGSGWPSFWQPITPDAVEEHEDYSYGMVRIEVTCARCGGHLGHAFDDGPPPTGLRYCINSLSLKFVPQ